MVTLTSAAIARIKRLCEERRLSTPSLRLATISGGCSSAGFQYDMKLDAAVSEQDLVFEFEGVKLVVDQASYPLLMGAEVDYEEALMKSGFSIHNPNALSTCACGRSFKVSRDGEGFHDSN